MRCILQTDGGSRGNPGPAAWGFVLLAEDGTTIDQGSGFLGTATNNAAEYQAVIEGFACALRHGATSVMLQADSELAIRQLSRVYKVKHPDMRRLADEAWALAAKIPEVRYEHIRREHNTAADALVNQVLDAAGFTKAPFEFRNRK